MPQFTIALVHLGRLAGLLDQSGTIDWLWFGDIKTRLLETPDRRQEFGYLLRALLDRQNIQQPSETGPTEGLCWEYIDLGVVKGGFAWNPDPNDTPWKLGFAAKAGYQFGANPPQSVDLAVLARLLELSGSGFSSKLGTVTFEGGFPVPSFLTKGSIAGEIPAAPGKPLVGLTVASSLEDRQLSYPSPQTSRLIWDCIRLGAFVLYSWTHSKADDGVFFNRLDKHGFPMLGKPASAIPTFPGLDDNPLDDNAPAPSLSGWADDVVSADDAAGILTFLWHLRALITGNESPELFEGSAYFRLGDPPGQAPVTGPPTQADLDAAGKVPQDGQGAYVGIDIDDTDDTGDAYTLVLLLNPGGPSEVTIPLATYANGALERAVIDQDTLPKLSAAIPASGLPIGAGQKLELQDDSGGKLLTLFDMTVNEPGGLDAFNGDYKLQVLLKPSGPVEFRVSMPALPVDVPPPLNDPEALFADVLTWVVSAVPADQAGDFGPVVKELANFAAAQVTPAEPDFAALVGSLATVLGQTAQGELVIGPLSIAIANGSLKPTLTLGPLDSADVPIYVGEVKADAEISLSEGFKGFHLEMTDIRLGKDPNEEPTGLGGKLVPDLKEVPGFHLELGWHGGHPELGGGGKVPIQQSIGPLSLTGLLVDVRNDSMSVGIDLTFKLAMITVSAYELGLRVPFTTGEPSVFLHGLGVSFDGSGIKLGGMFAEVTKTDPVTDEKTTDYVGGAVVSVSDLFELTGIGGYTEAGGKPSLFVFASLVAPLGGPPYMFITGVAGGFGFNRSLPPPGLLTKHPFIQVMSGEIGLSGESSAQLEQLSEQFQGHPGQHWIAAGVQFVSFGFINGKFVVAVSFGHELSLSILGAAAFGIQPIAYFELGFEATADKEKFLLVARISPNSYIIHPDIFSLRGDFALGVWYASPPGTSRSGDFLLSIGGYHPYFPKPDHYPDLSRISVKATVYGFVNLSVECFFACTPQAIMAGASVSLSAEFAGIGAGLDLYVDVFIQWDPFYMRAHMGVVVWFIFLGRHEIGVDITVWTPKFGGNAVIDLAIVSFEVEFGEPDAGPPPPSLPEFVSEKLAVPAEAKGNLTKVGRFNTEDAAGLFRLDVLSGRAADGEKTDSSAQEGLDPLHPIVVNAEFSFSVRTTLPIKVWFFPDTPQVVPIEGAVDLPLCGGDMLDLESTLNVVGDGIGAARKQWMFDYFATAQYGDEPLKGVQAGASLGARQGVGELGKKPSRTSALDAVSFSYDATPLPPDAKDLVVQETEPFREGEEYPLPLGGGSQAKGATSLSKTTLLLGAPPAALPERKATVGRRESAAAAVAALKPEPLRARARTASLQRTRVGSKTRTLTVSRLPTRVKAMSPPPSPPRRTELFGVSLRVMPVRAPVRVTGRRPETRTRARLLRDETLTPPEGTTGAFRGAVTVNAGEATCLDLTGGPRRLTTNLAFAGKQTVRAILLGRGDDVIADLPVTGSQALRVSPRARRAVLVGEGFEPPVGVSGAVLGTGAPTAQESVGVEHDSTLLVLGRRTFAGHGCVVASNSWLPFSLDPLDSVPGFELLRRLKNLRVHFPAVVADWSLVITVSPTVREPVPAASQVRWSMSNAASSGLQIVVGPDSTAFVMSIKAGQAWSLAMDLGREWRLAGSALVKRAVADLTDGLRTQRRSNFVDDRFQQAPEGTSTTVSLEVS